MSDHLTKLRPNGDGLVAAWCDEHRKVGHAQSISRGINALVTEARAHDDVYHGCYRTEMHWDALLSSGEAWGDVIDWRMRAGE